MNFPACTPTKDALICIFSFLDEQDLLQQNAVYIVCKLWTEIILDTPCLKQKVAQFKDDFNFVKDSPAELMRLFGGWYKFSQLPRFHPTQLLEGAEAFPQRIMIGKDKCQKLFMAFRLICVTNESVEFAIVTFEKGVCRPITHKIYGTDDRTFFMHVKKLIAGEIVAVSARVHERPCFYTLDYV